jgi:hypothetical protein
MATVLRAVLGVDLVVDSGVRFGHEGHILANAAGFDVARMAHLRSTEPGSFVALPRPDVEVFRRRGPPRWSQRFRACRRVGLTRARALRLLRSYGARRSSTRPSAISLRPALPELSTVLLVADCFHPVDVLTVEKLRNRDMRHGGCWRGSMPVFLTRRDPYDIALAHFQDWTTSVVYCTTPGAALPNCLGLYRFSAPAISSVRCTRAVSVDAPVRTAIVPGHLPPARDRQTGSRPDRRIGPPLPGRRSRGRSG